MKRKLLLKVGLSILLFLVCSSCFKQVETWDSNISHRIDDERGKMIVCHLAQAVVDYKKFNDGKYPNSISSLIPSYLTNSNTLLSQEILERFQITKVNIENYPDLLDVLGFASIHHNNSSNEFIVILSPAFYGSDRIPVGYFNDDTFTAGQLNYKKTKYDVLKLMEVCELIRKMNTRATK